MAFAGAGGKSEKKCQKATWGGMGATKKGQNGHCMWGPFNRDVLGLGGHRCQSLGTFYNGTKKLERSEYFLRKWQKMTEICQNGQTT